MTPERLSLLTDLDRKVLWLSAWTIHYANRIRENSDGLKVGGHQASSASSASILSALYFDVLRPNDRVAVKPHASPVFHAIQYLLGNQTLDNLKAFRAYGGAQSYPSRTKDADDVDFSTGSVGLGAAITCFASLVQDYLIAHGWRDVEQRGRMVSLVGDAELDEGNIFEALLEGYKHDLRNTWWIIDYNRHSLDGVIHEGLNQRFQDIFEGLGWDIVVLKYGQALRHAFEQPGGQALREWIDTCPNDLYSALTFRGGAAWRERLMADMKRRRPVMELIDQYSDPELSHLMTNLGGHDLSTLTDAFHGVAHDRPVCFIAYTIKGYGLPLAGHKDNHSGLLTDEQIGELRRTHGIEPGDEWEPLAGMDNAVDALQAFLDEVPFNSVGPRRFRADRVPVPERIDIRTNKLMSTQDGFGRLLNEVGRDDNVLGKRIVTTSPDVTVSTNLGPWVNRRGLYGRERRADLFRAEQIPSAQKWSAGPDGQHIELGIAENNLFLTLAAMGLSHSLFGQRLLPIGTLYDPFIQRGLDALNYACYQDARFILVATPSGVTLAPEGGAHQSIGTPLIGLAQDGLAAFEPAFVDELSVILPWAFDYIQREANDEKAPAGPEAEDAQETWLRDEIGGSVYLRLSTRTIEQPTREMNDGLAADIMNGGYWMRQPGPGCEVVICYTGAVAPEAIEAVGMLAEARRGVGLLAITSADRLNAGWSAADRARRQGQANAQAHIERLLEQVPRDAGLVTVLDGHPAALSWLGGVCGHRTKSLGVEHFGQTGTVADLYRHFGIDAEAIAEAAGSFARGRPYRHLRAV